MTNWLVTNRNKNDGARYGSSRPTPAGGTSHKHTLVFVVSTGGYEFTL